MYYIVNHLDILNSKTIYYILSDTSYNKPWRKKIPWGEYRSYNEKIRRVQKRTNGKIFHLPNYWRRFFNFLPSKSPSKGDFKPPTPACRRAGFGSPAMLNCSPLLIQLCWTVVRREKYKLMLSPDKASVPFRVRRVPFQGRGLFLPSQGRLGGVIPQARGFAFLFSQFSLYISC